MIKQTVKLARALSVSFSSEVLTQHAYVPTDSACQSCGGGCSTERTKPAHTLTVHLLTDNALCCDSPQGSRTLEARYAVVDDDGRGEYVALRAFKDDGELLAWIATIGQELMEVRTTLESHLVPLLHN